MIMSLSHNRAIYDILYLLLSYPEKREHLVEEQEKHHIDEDDDEEEDNSKQIDGYYNVLTR